VERVQNYSLTRENFELPPVRELPREQNGTSNSRRATIARARELLVPRGILPGPTFGRTPLSPTRLSPTTPRLLN